MNSKKNSFKRVAAGALAVLTVAAYTAPVANVGGLPSVNVLSADAATIGNTKVDFEDVSQYITSATDGEFTATAEDIAATDAYKFNAGNILTIVSKVPLKFGDGTVNVFTKAAESTTDLTLDGNGYKYIETVSSDNSTFTYKVKVVEDLTVLGATTEVDFFNTNTAITLIGGNFTPTPVAKDVYVNKVKTVNGAKVNVIKKGDTLIASEESFEAYVKIGTTGSFTKTTSNYNSTTKMYEAIVKIDTLADNGAEVHISHVDPVYNYGLEGTELIATDSSSNKSVAASVYQKLT